MVRKRPGEEAMVYWWQHPAVEKGQEYELSFSYKTDQKFTGKAAVMVHGCGINYLRHWRTTAAPQWTKGQLRFGPTETGNVYLNLENYGTGTVWFDNVMLVKLPPREMVNLMPNSGFESANPNGVPSGWWHHPGKLDPKVARVFVDESVSHSGKSSVKIEIKSKANVALIYSSLKPLNQGDTIYLSIFYKSNRTQPSEELSQLDYSSNIALVKFAYHFRGAYVSTKVSGKGITDGWEKLEATCVVIPHHEKYDFNELTIKLLMQDGMGDMWWDDIVVKKLNRYSLNLSPYAETVPLGSNKLAFVMENYTGAKEALKCELSLGGDVIASKSFTSTGEKEEKLSMEYKANVPGKYTARLSLIDEKENKVLFTGEKRIVVADRLETSIVVPTYVWPDRNVREVKETIRVYLPAEEREQSVLRMTVMKSGEKIKEELIQPGDGDIVYRFPVRGIAPGDYVMAIALLDKDKELLSVKEEVFHVMDHPKSVLKVKDGIILRDGKPFFPIGMYGIGTYNGTYQEYARAGFNFVHTYAFSGHFGDEATLVSDRDGIKLMDRIYRDGLLTLLETPRFKLSKGDMEGLRARYEALSNHPSVLFYYEEESLIHGHASYESGEKWSALLREIHPEGLICLADWLHVRDKEKDPRSPDQKKAYGEGLRFPEELCDIGVDYWYPFPLPEGETEIVIPDWLKFHMDTERPIWVVPQSNKRHWIKDPPERAKRQRWPLPEEYRIQAYLSIVHGARGLFYFGHHFLGKEKEAHWEYLKALVSEISDMTPIILSPMSNLAVKISGSDKIDSVLKEYEGAYYLIAVYRDVPPVEVTFNLPFKPVSVKVMNENREITPQGKDFLDTFGKYAVHVYEIRK